MNIRINVLINGHPPDQRWFAQVPKIGESVRVSGILHQIIDVVHEPTFHNQNHQPLVTVIAIPL